jgi:hypothetical protein
MNNTRRFELAEALAIKYATMEKVIQSIQQYRPFLAEDSRKAIPYTGAAGALAGGLGGAVLGGGGALLKKLTRDKDSEEEAPSILGGALKGGLIGGTIGGGLGVLSPLAGPSAVPHIGDAIRSRVTADEKQRMVTAPKWYEKLLPQKGRDSWADLQGRSSKAVTHVGLPQMTIKDFMDAYQEAKAQQENPNTTGQ